LYVGLEAHEAGGRGPATAAALSRSVAIQACIKCHCADQV